MINPPTYDTTFPRPDPQTWPLDDANLPFPCQMGGKADPIIRTVTPVVAGASTLVQFSGSAVHGGGSCQFSINYGDPTSADPNDWHVIYTIIGGCPASSTGNIETIGEDQDQRPLGRECGNSKDRDCVRQFDVPIPKGLKNGNATFAWSWFNKIGNREMYMNCAPITISGGRDGDDSFIKGLPAIFVANIDGKPCMTAKPEGAVLNIPNPGVFGEVLEDPDPEAIGNCSPNSVVPYPDFENGRAAGTSSASAPSSVASSAGQELSSAVVSGSPSNKPLTTAILTFTTMTTATDSPPAASSALYNKPSGWVDCSGPGGSLVCLDQTHFGICNSGYADPQLVPVGSTCDIEKNMIVPLA